VEDQQGTQPDHMEVGVLDHTAVAAGILQHVLSELSYAACILLAGLVAVVHYNTPHPRREEETANISRRIPEHNSCHLVVTPLPHSLIKHQYDIVVDFASKEKQTNIKVLGRELSLREALIADLELKIGVGIALEGKT